MFRYIRCVLGRWLMVKVVHTRLKPIFFLLNVGTAYFFHRRQNISDKNEVNYLNWLHICNHSTTESHFSR